MIKRTVVEGALDKDNNDSFMTIVPCDADGNTIVHTWPLEDPKTFGEK